MKNFLFTPFKRTFREMELNKQIKEEIAQSDLKGSVMPRFITMNYMFLIIYGIFYIAAIYLIFESFFKPVSLLKLVLIVLLTWYFSSLHKNIYPKARKIYLKSIGYGVEKDNYCKDSL